MKTQPLVTIGVLSYNNTRYLALNLESTIQEGYSNRELIIVDDCSQDESVEVINTWVAKHPNEIVEVIVRKHNLGICSGMNEILKAANGKYITTIDSDDVYLSNKLMVQVPLLENAPEKVGVVFSPIQPIGPSGELLPTPAIWADVHEGEVFLPLLKRDFVLAMGTLIRRSCLDVVGPFDESLSYEDWDMWLRISKKYEFKFLDKISALYRLHPTSAMYSRKAALTESSLRLLLKYWGESPESDAIIRGHVRELSEQLYQYGSPKAKQWLRVRWQQNKDVRSLAFIVLASLGVPGARVKQIQHLLKRS